MQTHYRACHLCEAICGIEITTEGDKILSIKGDKSDPLGRGHICPKATALEDLHNDPDRLRLPVKKVDGDWQTISWEEAFETVGSRLVDIQRRYGDDAVGIYSGNPNTHNYGSMTHGGLLRKYLGTKSIYTAASLDQLPLHITAMAMYGHQFLIPVPDIDNSNYMLIIGGNPLASNGSMMTVPDVSKRLKSIQQRAGRVVVIDPRRTETAELADEHHFIKPGSDAFLLMAMIHTLFAEELVTLGHLESVVENLDNVRESSAAFTPELAAAHTGIGAETIRQLARDMAKTEGAVCYGRMGVSVQVFGTLCQWAIQVINILTNSMDVKGGAIAPSPAFGFIGRGSSGAGHYGRRHSRVRGLPEFTGQFPSTVLAEEILAPGEGQIRALVTAAGNPVLAAPNGKQMDKALESLEFMVSIDFYINASTAHADIILPPTAALEHDHYDLAYHRLAVRNTARYNQPLFEGAPGSLHDWQILNGVAEQIAKHKEVQFQAYPEPSQIIDKGLRAGPYGEDSGVEQPLSIEELKKHPHGVDLGPLKPALTERLNTPQGKIEMSPEFIVADLARLATTKASDALLLIGRRHVRSNNSWMHNSHRLVKGKPRWQLLMHPADMANHGLEDYCQVKVKSRVGEVQTQVVGSDEVMQGVVSLPHGWGHKRKGIRMSIASQQDGVSCNDITDNELFDAISGNSALNGVPVSISAA